MSGNRPAEPNFNHSRKAQGAPTRKRPTLSFWTIWNGFWIAKRRRTWM